MNSSQGQATSPSFQTERSYAPDRDFQLAALRVVLGLPRRLGRSGGTL